MPLHPTHNEEVPLSLGLLERHALEAVRAHDSCRELAVLLMPTARGLQTGTHELAPDFQLLQKPAHV